MADKQNEELRAAFNENLQLIGRTLKTQAKDPAAAQETLQDLVRLPHDEMIQTVFELADEIKLGEKRKGDPSFNAFQAFASGTLDVAALGAHVPVTSAVQHVVTGESFSKLQKENKEHARLLKKEFPKATVSGNVFGFLAPLGGAKVFSAGAKGGEALLSAAGRLTQSFGGAGGLSAHVGKVLSQNFITKTTAQAIGGTAAFEASRRAVPKILGAEAGKETVGEFVQDVASGALEGTEAGLALAPFAAGGYAGYHLVRGMGKVATKSLQVLGKHMGRDLKYQIENPELIRQIIEMHPDAVFAESTEKILPLALAEQQKFISIQNEAKQSILTAIGNKTVVLEDSLKETAKSLNGAIEGLRQASGKNIAGAARVMNDKIGDAYRMANSQYGHGLRTIVENKTASVDLTPTLDLIEGTLRNGRAIDRAGNLLSGSRFAQQNPELFEKLANYWEQLGGPVRAQGGKPGLNMNLADTILLKQEIGGLASFGKQATQFEGTMRQLYQNLRVQTERVAPELRPLNARYAAQRERIDTFRKVVGNEEAKIARKLEQNLYGPKATNNYVREAIEAFSDLGPEFEAATAEAMSQSERLQMMAKLAKDPRSVFGQVRTAYVKGDVLAIDLLETAAKNLPELRPHLTAARKQAETIREVMEASRQASKAFKDSEIAASLSQQIPEASSAIERFNQAKTQASELQRVLPADRIKLEQALRAQGEASFQNSPIQSGIAEKFAAENPAASAPLKKAEAARVAERLKTGKGMEKTPIEEIPILGQTLFSLRKMATPMASNVLNVIGKAKPATRKALIIDLFEHLNGSEQLSKAALLKLQKQVGPEAALIIYAQQGGGRDIAEGAEQLGGTFKDQ